MYEIGLSGSIRRDPWFISHLESGLQSLIDEVYELKDLSVNIRENHNHAFLSKIKAHFNNFDYTVTGLGENELEAYENAKELLLDWIDKTPAATSSVAPLAKTQEA